MEKYKSGFWDIGYSDLNISCMGGPSSEIYEIAPIIRPQSKICELGAGEGRNSLYLALLGHEVVATDISEHAITKLNFLASELKVNVNSFTQDLKDYHQEDEVDVLIAQTVFHFTTAEIWKDKLKQAKAKTKPGGIHCFTNFLDDEKYPIPKEILDYGHKKSFRRGDLEEFYSDWDIIRSDLYVKWDSHPGIPTHSHLVEKIVVRKPIEEEKDWAKIEKRNVESDLRIDDDIFESLQLGESFEDIIKKVALSEVQKKIEIKQKTIGGNNQLATTEYFQLLDLYYGNRGLQFTNSVLTGKYLYFSQPTEVLCAMRPVNN